MDNKDILKAALAEFENLTPDQIAALVQKRGIRGRAGTTYNCPLALMLSGTHGGQFVVGRKFIARRSGSRIDKIPTPKNLASFERKFDIAGYPDLIAPPPRCLAKPGEKRAASRQKKGSGAKPRGKPVLRHRHVVVNRIAQEVGRFND